MAKRVFVIHGWEGYPEEGWRPWLRKELEGKGFEVIIPAMPDTATPTFAKWVPYLAQTVGAADENTYFVCHSLGCITTLRYLETLKENQKIGGVVFVAGFGRDLEYEGYKGELTNFLQAFFILFQSTGVAKKVVSSPLYPSYSKSRPKPATKTTPPIF